MTKSTCVLRKVSELEPHPAALVPIDAEDSAAIEASVREIGVIAPLIITADNKIVDGVNRWRQAKSAGIETLECRVTDQLPGVIVSQCLMARRKGSSAQHILVFLETNKHMVLQAHDEHTQKGSAQARYFGYGRKKPNKLSLGSRDPKEGADPFEDWSSRAIAARLKVSEKDVQKGIELLVCRERKHIPEGTSRGGLERNADPSDPGDAAWLAEMQSYRDAAMSGQPLPLRRWKAAVAGRVATKGADAPKKVGKAHTNYPELFYRCASSLLNCFEHWQEIEDAEGSKVALLKWDEAVQSMPERLLAPVYDRMGQLSQPEIKRLINSLKKHLQS